MSAVAKSYTENYFQTQILPAHQQSCTLTPSPLLTTIGPHRRTATSRLHSHNHLPISRVTSQINTVTLAEVQTDASSEHWPTQSTQIPEVSGVKGLFRIDDVEATKSVQQGSRKGGKSI